MPKFVNYDQIRAQTSTFTYWEQTYTLLPKDDPLCDDVLKARQESLGFIDFTYEENGEAKNMFSDDDTVTVENDLGEKTQISSQELATMGAFDLGIPKQFDIENKWVQDQLNCDIELFNKIERELIRSRLFRMR